MKIKRNSFISKVKYLTKGHKWFAWYPVKTHKNYIWLEYVIRKGKFINLRKYTHVGERINYDYCFIFSYYEIKLDNSVTNCAKKKGEEASCARLDENVNLSWK